MAVDLDAGAYATARRMMVDCQIRPADVTSPALIDAMLWAPRELFLPKPKRPQAYVGEHVEVSPGRYELDPRDFAKMIDAAEPSSDDLALVVGGGFGYAPAILSRLVAAVVSLEVDEAMAAAAEHACSDASVDNVMIHKGPLSEGCAAHAPYNLIFVNGGTETLPAALFDQLADGGRLAAIRVDGAVGRCEIAVRSGDAIGRRRAFDAVAPILPGFERAQEFVF